MEFGKLKTMSVGEVATTVATEGGAVVAGLVGAGFAGKQFENIVKPGVLPTSPMLDKAIAYLGNNGPKVVLYMLLKGQGERGIGGYGKDMGKGVLGSVVMDTLMRSGNNFAPGTTFKLFGYDIMSGSENTNVTPQMQQNMQKVLQENSSLRQQLNGALQRIASASPNVNVTPIRTAQPQTIYAPPPPDHDRAYGMMQTTPESENRREEFGAMTPPIEDERNRNFGQMNKAQLNFAGETDNIASAFGML